MPEAEYLIWGAHPPSCAFVGWFPAFLAGGRGRRQGVPVVVVENVERLGGFAALVVVRCVCALWWDGSVEWPHPVAVVMGARDDVFAGEEEGVVVDARRTIARGAHGFARRRVVEIVEFVNAHEVVLPVHVVVSEVPD